MSRSHKFKLVERGDGRVESKARFFYNGNEGTPVL